MSNDSKLITIYRSQNKADFLVIEALLNSAGIEYFSLNEGLYLELGLVFHVN